MRASDWSKNKWGVGWGGALDPPGPFPYPRTTFANFSQFNKGEHMVSTPGSNLYHTGRVEFELYNKCEYWINLACFYTEILTQVTQVLRVGYSNSNDLNCIQLALEWRVP